MSDVIKKILDFIAGKDIDARHEDLVKQVKTLENLYEAEILRLRADLAAVTAERDYVMTEGLFSADQIRILKTERDAAIAERDRMLEALRPIVPSKVLDEEESTLVSNRLLNDALDAYLARSRHDDDETPAPRLKAWPRTPAR